MEAEQDFFGQIGSFQDENHKSSWQRPLSQTHSQPKCVGPHWFPGREAPARAYLGFVCFVQVHLNTARLLALLAATTPRQQTTDSLCSVLLSETSFPQGVKAFIHCFMC
jgi:hypothetical protein